MISINRAGVGDLVAIRVIRKLFAKYIERVMARVKDRFLP